MDTKSTPKFYCEKCDYKCAYPAHWKQHISGTKHLNEGKRKTRCDKILDPQCELCAFKTTNLTNMKAHKLTKHSCSEERQKCFTLYCAKCDFGTFAEILFSRHLETKKHLKP